MDRSQLDIKIASSVNDFLALQADWDQLQRELQREAQEIAPFLSWQWMYTWWRVYARPHWQLRIGTLWDGQKLVGIFPFYLKNGLLKGLYFLGTGEDEICEVSSEYLDVLLLPSVNAVETASLLNQLLQGAHYCAFLRVLSSANIAHIFAAKTAWCNTLKPLGFRYMYGLSHDWRRMLGANARLRRKIKAFDSLLDSGRLKIVTCSAEAYRPAMLQDLARLHALRWQARGKQGTFSDERFLRFHDEYSAAMLAQHQLTLLALWVDNTVVASIYCIDHGAIRYFYQSGIDPEHAAQSPGYLALFAAIDAAAQKHMMAFDFMLGGSGETYKKDFSVPGEAMGHYFYWKRPFYKKLHAVLNKAGWL